MFMFYIFTERLEDQNESIQVGSSQFLRILKTEKPDSCSLSQENGKLKIGLKFALSLKGKARTVNFFFKTSKTSDVHQSFFIALMKMTVENGLVIAKMKKALDAKDKEIDEYKRSGGTLVRGKIRQTKQ